MGIDMLSDLQLKEIVENKIKENDFIGAKQFVDELQKRKNINGI